MKISKWKLDTYGASIIKCCIISVQHLIVWAHHRLRLCDSENEHTDKKRALMPLFQMLNV